MKLEKIFLVLLTILLMISLRFDLFAIGKKNLPHCVIGGGYLQTRKYSGAVFQAEYKSGYYFCNFVRPQVTFMLSEHGSGYIGVGIGLEWKLKQKFVVIVGFSPGFYWRGSGRDLGCPLEFRSAFEISYETEKKFRLGFQILHVSNAHLSKQNPGFNSYMFCIGIPIRSM